MFGDASTMRGVKSQRRDLVAGTSMLIRPVVAAVLACLVANSTGLPACAAEIAGDRLAVRLLNRLGFGPTIADLRHVEAVGADRYIAEQLDPQAISEPPELIRRLAALDTLRLEPAALFEVYWLGSPDFMQR
jgi:hypothetical protein